ncbi:hypothetical protein [Rhizobium sp. SL86]|uniref:hypothetical protein n=1 Tax=Rhizobium sp. SL86 TaxID=2995148 RepID=UPI00227394ED|nr:hypothetical protein [Rhizobium sp. SL86]MCY1668221.1 hypothetical protein [Rhizobium sp. SL86]
MTGLRGALETAVARGLVEPTKLGALEAHIEAALPGLREAPRAAVDDPARPAVIETETPRFIRGFHDVLITLGLTVLLIGVGGLGAIIGLLPVVLILAEILVRRQRLALPAVALTIAMAIWAVVICQLVADDMGWSGDSYLLLALRFLAFPLMMLAFYWRYRIPVALAFVILSFFAVLFLGLVGLLEIGLRSTNILIDHPSIVLVMGILAALGLFAVAMTYDLSDPARQSRRSDIAFWLHLAAAPALLYAGLATLFIVSFGTLSDFDDQMRDASTPGVIALVAILMLIGVVIDRRAFVTSGLITLIVTVTTLLRNSAIEMDNVIFLALITVGVIVLSVGIGWQPLRRVVVGLFPPELKQKLPPLQ